LPTLRLLDPTTDPAKIGEYERLKALRERQKREVDADWQPSDRPLLERHQIPPAGDWSLWLLEGGHGCGKTEACSRYFARYMRMHAGTRGRIIAPTFGDAVESCVEGPSGLLSIDPDIRWLLIGAGWREDRVAERL
jgi:phage terminase large subunit-like protein